MRYIEINKEEVPYNMQVLLPSRMKGGTGERLYDLFFDYNTTHDFFTMTITLEGELLVLAEKMVLDYCLIKNYNNALLPAIKLVMRNRPGQQGDVNYENMGDTVLLAVEVGDYATVEA